MLATYHLNSVLLGTHNDGTGSRPGGTGLGHLSGALEGRLVAQSGGHLYYTVQYWTDGVMGIGQGYSIVSERVKSRAAASRSGSAQPRSRSLAYV